MYNKNTFVYLSVHIFNQCSFFVLHNHYKTFDSTFDLFFPLIYFVCTFLTSRPYTESTALTILFFGFFCKVTMTIIILWVFFFF